MEIIGRKQEQLTLKRALESKTSEFVVVYGRRRVGKTYLISNFFDKFFFSFTGSLNLTNSENLNNFVSSLKASSTITNYLDAFYAMRENIKNDNSLEKKVIFIDEISWICNGNNSFLGALEHFWNDFCSKRSDILLIVCSSSSNWVTNKVFKDRGGLYNRVTERILLEPLSLLESSNYLNYKGINYDKFAITEIYMALGGIPFYLNLILGDLSITQNIDRIVFQNNAPLNNEFQELYSSMFSNYEEYTKLIEFLFSKKQGYTRNEIVKELNLPDGGNLSNVLRDLELNGFIIQNNRFPNKKQNCLYKLIDQFSIFYLTFSNAINSHVENLFDRQEYIPLINSWKETAFETICENHPKQIKKALGIAGVYSQISFYHDQNIHLDFILNRKDRTINLCEIKYSQNNFEINKDYGFKLRERKQYFSTIVPKNRSIIITFITPFGLAKTPYSSDYTSNVTLDDLFS